MIWIEFIICAGLIIWTASLLSKYGDVLADKTGLGRAWVGALLIAGVTSLPELATGVSAVAWLGQPNLAAGAVMGSCLFNLALIAMMDLAYQPGRILAKAHDGHILSSGLGILLLGMVAMGVLVGVQYSGVGIPGFGVLSLSILGIYALGGRLISTVEQARQIEVLDQEAQAGDYAHISARKAWLVFIFSAVAVVGLGIWLSTIGDRIATTTGLSASFVGNLFLAASTSLPEIAASLAAIRIGAIDMAIANVLGSNMFNIAILSIYDMADGSANFWASLTNANGFAAVMAMMMTGVVIVSLMVRVSPKTPFCFSWDGIALVAMYLGSIAMLYLLG
jgi:cation:H+ antiporter